MKVSWSRTHFIDKPEKRNESDRRINNWYLANDRRSGIACRRKEMNNEKNKKDSKTG
jgi:Na+-transporting NADH:ubiquinone oxidoreductase subunit NqrF